MPEQHYRSLDRVLMGLASEISKLAIACNIDIDQPNVGERVLRNDDSVCGRKNEAAFQKLRQHLMALFPLQEQAIEALGPEVVEEKLDRVRAAIRDLRAAGKSQ